MVGNEIFRQRDKSNNNDIGYFHQRIFQYIDKCHVPEHGKEGGWDVIYQNSDGIELPDDDDCACFLVDAIAQRSQNIKWETTVDQKRVSHRRIRRVSLDQFYALVTGEQDAFYQMCMILPKVISDVVTNSESKVPHDTVLEELKNIANSMGETDEDVAIYLLGFNSYNGFAKRIQGKEEPNENMLKRIYAYAKGISDSLKEE